MGWRTSLRAGSANTVIAFAMGAAPLSFVTLLTIDSGRISTARTDAHSALSAAVWSAATDPVLDPAAARQAFFDHQPQEAVYLVTSLSFTLDSTGELVGTAAIIPPSGLMSLFGLAPDEIVISVRAPRSARVLMDPPPPANSPRSQAVMTAKPVPQ